MKLNTVETQKLVEGKLTEKVNKIATKKKRKFSRSPSPLPPPPPHAPCAHK